MGKTNRERVNIMVTKWHTTVANREHGLLPRWALDLLIDMATVLVNKAERRGARKVSRFCKALELPPVHISNTRCVPPQPAQRQYTRDDAARLVMALVDAVFGVASYNSTDNNAKLKDMRDAVIDAITGSAKPQFDAEKVRELIRSFELDVAFSASCHWNAARRICRDFAVNAVTKKRAELYAALGLNDG